MRREFCPWLLGVCPLLQEYGNISYKIQSDDGVNAEQEPPDINSTSKRKMTTLQAKKGMHQDEVARTDVPILCIEIPD